MGQRGPVKESQPLSALSAVPAPALVLFRLVSCTVT